MSGTSPARARYKAARYAKRHAARLAAEAMHAAAVKRTGATVRNELLTDAALDELFAGCLVTALTAGRIVTGPTAAELDRFDLTRTPATKENHQ